MESHPRITIAFNVLLVLYSAGYGVLTFAISDAAKKLPLQGIVLTSLVDFVRYLIMMFISAYFARGLWNGMFVDIFNVRAIAYREAIAFVVAIGLLVS